MRMSAMMMAVMMLVLSCSDDDTKPSDATVDMAKTDIAGTDMVGSDMPKADLAGADLAQTDTSPPADATPSVVVVSCSATTPDKEVNIQGNAYSPATSSVSAGQLIRWTNADALPHTVTSGNPAEASAGSLFQSGNLSTSATFCLKFNQVGSFEYFCEVHPTTMDNGLVTVQ